jgi:GNAT superfamily N-acetyltransferase
MDNGEKTPARRLIEAMAAFRDVARIPVRLSLGEDCASEVSVHLLATAVGQRRLGHASHMMKALSYHADRLGVVLSLDAMPDRGESEAIELEDLVSFYRRFGFRGQMHPGEPSTWMCRDPGAAPDFGCGDQARRFWRI